MIWKRYGRCGADLIEILLRNFRRGTEENHERFECIWCPERDLKVAPARCGSRAAVLNLLGLLAHLGNAFSFCVALELEN
jgi:hypothetical protein